MITLMTYGGTAAEDAPGTRTGGLPLAAAGFAWPHCATCGGAMQFLAQIRLEDLAGAGRGLFAVFLCANDPGRCASWAPRAGGNRALVLPPRALTAAAPPASGRTGLGEVSAVTYVDVDAATYFDAATGWAKSEERSPRDVLGKLGGEPEWLQGDETPRCTGCEGVMMLVAQLEEGHDHRTGADFGGGGCGYGFLCAPCGEAVFLWQA
ncbi:hypothetical protein [Streptomyces chumphonensis]|uniref:hypothetical protein n=1 Tax=Streptomyces chumphonensis TaxID=1214925 RepID=UPI003D70B7F7